MDFEIARLKNISIYTDHCLVTVEPSEGETLQVITPKEKAFTFKAAGDTFTVQQNKINIIRSWFTRAIEIKIRVPQTFFGLLRLRNRYGSVSVSKVSAEFEIASDVGAVTCKQLKARGFRLRHSAGDVDCYDISATGNFAIKVSNGSIKADSISAGAISAEISNGPVTVGGLVAQRITLKTSNGKIDGKALNASDISLNNHNGKIIADVTGIKDAYKINLETTNGIVNVDGGECGRQLQLNPNGASKLFAKTDNGSIDIRFK